MIKQIDKMITKGFPKTVGISLFEEQIVRAFFLSDDFSFLKQLSLKNEVIIFTNRTIGNFLDIRIKQLSINKTKIIEMEIVKESFLVKVFSFCLKWSDPSSATLRNLYRERNSGRMRVFGFWLRKIFFYIFSHSVLLKSFFRKLLFLSYKLKYVEDSTKSIMPCIDVFISTALTNSESDLPLSIYFKRKGIPVISSLRSWDNLVTKGTLKFQPDLFLSHSGYMTDMAIHIHGIKASSVIQSVTPAYQKRFIGDTKHQRSSSPKITYGCIGPVLNPDELNFINWLGQVSRETDSCISIVQHPKFKHNLSRVDTGNLVFETFDYLTSKLQDYYDFIAQQDLVIASGTSFALDTLFVQTPLIGLAFEVIEQDYWLSHLRSYDELPHSKYLFDNLLIKKVSSKLELSKILKSKVVHQNLINSTNTLRYLTGDTEMRFDNQLLKILN